MAEPSARHLAVAALSEWRRKREFADAIIDRLLSRTKLAARDRAFAVELFFGVLRNLTSLDFCIGCLRAGRLETGARDLLRTGLYQLLLLSIPEHAAIYETVNVASERQRALVNGILRSACRRRSELIEKINSAPLDTRASHPPFLIERWQTSFGPQNTELLCAWNNRPAPIYARINKLKTGRESFIREHPNAKPLAEVENFVELKSLPMAALNRGECYIQDPSTAMPCVLLDPQPGEHMLDACAAPGGKIGYLAELMQNRGLIAACDREEKRVRLLTENLNRLGVSIGTVALHDWSTEPFPTSIAKDTPFDRILIDAPCTNTGVMRRRVDVRWRLGSDDFARMQKRQVTIARHVLPVLKPGGAFVYSTCSLESEENEGVVEGLLKMEPALQLIETRQCLPFRDGFDGAFAAKIVKTA